MSVAWEPLLVLLLVVASAGLFARNLARKLEAVRAGAPDRVRTDHPAERLRRTAREVLVQTRVIGGRPVVGVLHGLVFLGFLAFGPATVQHFLEPFGLSILGPLRPAYEAVMAVVAVLVTLGILGLAFRRFVLVRLSPDPRSVTSAVVAAFIVVLMVTYLNGLLEEPLWPRANWWLHAAVILAFPHVILRSKHLHILLAPVTIWLRTPRTGDLAPLDLEALTAEDATDVALGLETLKTLPWKLRLDFLACVECRRCTDGCPANVAGNELDPRAFVLAGRKAIAAGAPADPVIGPVIGEAALGYCTTCGACENGCPVGVEHLQLLVGAKRAQALATGKGVVAQELFHAIEAYGNPFSRPRSDRRALLSALDVPRFGGADGEWLLWLGCVWGYNPDQKNAVAAFVAVLRAAGVPFGVLDDEPCCGHHSRRQGEEAQFQDLARRGLAELAEHEVARVVTPCPHCLHTLRHEHPQLDGERAVEVVHHTELLARLLEKGALRLDPAARSVATYHDPCYLARFEGQVEAPRRVLAAAGTTLAELPRRGARTLCCGGGGGAFAREQKTGKRIDQPRRAEIAASGAPLLVTACPECRMMLGAAVDETRDIAEVVAGALRASDRAEAGVPASA